MFQGSEGAQVMRVHPLTPTGEISSEIKLAKGVMREFLCTTVTTRSRYESEEGWGPWEVMSNCSETQVNGTRAVKPHTRRREIPPPDEVSTTKVTLLT